MSTARKPTAAKPAEVSWVRQKKLARSAQVDVLLLAKASMARLAEALSAEIGCPVLSSPRTAVEYVRDILN